MDDYIVRQEAIDAVYYATGDGDKADFCADVIRSIPSADVEPVVRCKDCKHYQFADNRAFGFPVKRCEFTGFEDVEDNDFCSRGVRMDCEHERK